MRGLAVGAVSLLALAGSPVSAEEGSTLAPRSDAFIRAPVVEGPSSTPASVPKFRRSRSLLERASSLWKGTPRSQTCKRSPDCPRGVDTTKLENLSNRDVPLWARHADTGAAQAAALDKRQVPVAVSNQNLGTSYIVTLALGTPPQNVSVILDTGSAELWVNPTCETSGQAKYCASFSQFDYTKSTTIQDTGEATVLSYGKGNTTIEYVQDTVTIGCKCAIVLICLPVWSNSGARG
jgi:hypothetical protein